jgi:hypothetical protein
MAFDSHASAAAARTQARCRFHLGVFALVRGDFFRPARQTRDLAHPNAAEEDALYCTCSSHTAREGPPLSV